VSNDLLAGLTKVGNHFATKLRAFVSNGQYAEEIAKGISVGSAVGSSEGTSHIDVIIDAPMARAFEWGSGIHATRGERKEYRIPNEGGGDHVSFSLESWPKYKPPPNRKYFYFTHVMHPGIEAKPYIEPTIQAEKEEAKKILGQAFKAQILTGMPKQVIIEVKL
jgi:hypothetical protein